MTTASLASEQPALPVKRWGPVVEWLLVGGITPVCFVVSWLLRAQLDLDTAELVVGFTMFHAAFILNDPHFSVTYLLFYEDFKARAFGEAFPRGTRIRYVIAGVFVPIALAVWGFGAVLGASAEALGLLIELMFFLVGWHYVKQGFGVMVVLSARRGVRFGLRERWVLLAHCFSGWIYAWANPHNTSHLAQERGVIYLTVPRPQMLELIALVALVASTVGLVGMLVRKRLREGPLPIHTPLVALLCSVWLWLIFSAIDPLVRYMAPALHSIQYLYFVWLLKRNEARSRTVEPYFEPPPRERLAVLAFFALALGWLLFHGAPDALDALFADAPGIGLGTSLGVTPYFAALYALVNIHHYFMDFVIWRRDNPRTRFLTS